MSAPNSGGGINVTAAVTIAGAGTSSTVITGLTAGAPLLAIRHDGVRVQDMTLDAQSRDLGDAVYIVASNTIIQRTTMLGGSHFFAIYAAGDAAGPNGSTGNELISDTVSDWTQSPLGDGISWSYQHNSLITNLNHTGSRLALYRDTNTSVTNDTFHPSTRPQQADVTQGFWISAPSDHITITNFTTYGDGGRMSANGGAVNTNVALNNERFLGTRGELRIDGAQALTVTGCNLGTANTLAFAATVPMSNVVVQNCTSLPSVSFWDDAAVSVAFNSDTFPANRNAAGTPCPTFTRYGRTVPAPANVAVTGGSWMNQAGAFSSGGPLTFVVTKLGGYN